MKRKDLALPLLVLLAGCAGADPQPSAAPPPASGPSAAAPPAAANPKPAYPAAARRRVTNDYHGVQIADDYQWLEKNDGPEVKAFSRAQNAFARKWLDASPARPKLRGRVEAILSAQSSDRFALEHAGGRTFALEDQPPKQQPSLIVLASADDLASRKVVVDPNVIDPSGATTIDFYVPSQDGKKVAVSLSKGGTENGTVHVYDVDTGKETGDVVPYANSGTAGGSLTWSGDGKGFWYTRHPHPGERPPEDTGFFQQIWFHRLGDESDADAYAFGKDFPRIAEIELETSDDGRTVHASVQKGDGGEYWHYVRGGDGAWKELATLEDKVVHASFGGDGRLYLLSRKGAPKGQILRVDPKKPDLAKAEVVVPESDVVIQRYAVGKTRLYTVDLVGGPSQIRMFDIAPAAKPKKGDKAEKAPASIAVPPVSAVKEIVRLAGDDVLFRNQSFTQPPAWYRYDAKAGATSKTALATKPPVSFDDMEAVRETCVSKDGTKVPISIVRKKGTALDGKSPALLIGYGGYGISLSPSFRALFRVWYDHGGVLAVANLRGGGELGEAWHRAGNLTKKQNVFDDFHGCARFLVESMHTSPDKLAILGGSNGGLLMGASLTQHPEAYKAVVALVGIYDMLRVELTPNGEFNVTELGTVKDRAQFDALRAYSPFHAVKDGVAYPATLFLTGANDPRVDPFHSRKMVARLQAATAGSAPILLRTSDETGHGGGTPLKAEIEEWTDIFTFLFGVLAIPYGASTN